MTAAEAKALIRASTPFATAKGDMVKAYALWKASNPGEARALELWSQTVFSDLPAAGSPVLKTKMGRGLVGLLEHVAEQAPPPPPPRQWVNGAIVKVCGNIDPALLASAGVNHIAADLDLPQNMVELKAASWGAFVKGGFFASRGGTANTDADFLEDMVGAHGLRFLVVDTESHKADSGGQMIWTENLYAALRLRLPQLPIWNVTFGIHQNASVVNHAALRKWNIEGLWETYEGSGSSLGVEATVAHVWSQGWHPVHVCLSHLVLGQELPAALRLRKSEGTVGDIFLYAADDGPAQDALRSGVKFS